MIVNRGNKGKGEKGKGGKGKDEKGKRKDQASENDALSLLQPLFLKANLPQPLIQVFSRRGWRKVLWVIGRNATL